MKKGAIKHLLAKLLGGEGEAPPVAPPAKVEPEVKTLGAWESLETCGPSIPLKVLLLTQPQVEFHPPRFACEVAASYYGDQHRRPPAHTTI